MIAAVYEARRFALVGVLASRSVARAEQPAVARVQFELPDQPAAFAIDQDGSDLLGRLVEFLGPLPQSHQHRKNPRPFGVSTYS